MEIAVALVTLTLMEIVLGIDNIVFISIVSGKLPENQQPLARKLGLALALLTRLALLGSIYYVVRYLTGALFELTDLGIPHLIVERLAGEEHATAAAFAESNGISWRDLILIGGGLFLVVKSVLEIHHQMEPHAIEKNSSGRAAFVGILVQIALLDVIFSLDSVITAVGMVKEMWIMVTAILISMGVMLVFAEPISRFIKQHQSLKMLALSFLILIGVLLVAEGIGAHLDKGYVYFAMFFSLAIEFLNMWIRKKQG